MGRATLLVGTALLGRVGARRRMRTRHPVGVRHESHARAQNAAQLGSQVAASPAQSGPTGFSQTPGARE